MNTVRCSLLDLHDRLLAHFGPQNWWPGNGPWDVCAGAVLTQNTRWANAERALQSMVKAGYSAPETVRDAPDAELEALIRPAGFFRQKRRAIKALARWIVEGGGFAGRGSQDDDQIRPSLLALPGIGPETADCILLYAFGRPAFIADAYARRILSRTGLWRTAPEAQTYDALRAWAESRLPSDPGLLNEFHALLVALGKDYCRRQPRCSGCPANRGCRSAVTGHSATRR